MEPSTSSRKGPSICEICNANPSKYMCPRCGVPYCSLTCYRHDKHLQCSESFYKDCVVESIKAEGTSDPASVQKMNEILKRVNQQFGESNLDDDEGEEEEEELDSDDDEPLSKRLEGIDLNNADQVWSHLTEDERREFQALASNAELAGDIIPEWVPWWNEEVERKLVVEVEESGSGSSNPFLKLHPNQPDWLDPIPKMSDLTKVKPNGYVANGLMNVIAAYVWVARLFNGEVLDSDKVIEVASSIVHLSSFLSSERVFKDVEHAVADVPLNACRVPLLSEGGDTIQSTLNRDIWIITKGPVNSPSSKTYLLSALTQCYNVFVQASKLLKKKGADDDKGSGFASLFPPPPPMISADLKLINKAKRKVVYLIAFANEFVGDLDLKVD